MNACKDNIKLVRVWLRALRPHREHSAVRRMRDRLAKLIWEDRVTVYELESIAQEIGILRRDGNHPHFFKLI